jgi:uncharacterized membrane protein HdeD (DUF308 family)
MATSSSSTANTRHSGRVTTAHDALGENVDPAIVLDVGTKATPEQLRARRNLTPICTLEQLKVSIGLRSLCTPPHRCGDDVGPAYNGADLLPRHNGSGDNAENHVNQGAAMTDTPSPTSDLIHRIWISSVLFGLLAAILGVVTLLWPGPSIIVAAALFGVYLVVSGIAMVVLAFGSPLASGGTRFFSFISGVVSIILGVLAFRHFGEGYAVLLLAIWIGVGFIFRGVAAVASATSFPRFPGRGWAIFFAVLSIIAGIVVLAYPFDSIVTLALVVGIWLVVLGVMEVVSAFGIRSDAKKVGKAIHAGTPAATAPR